MATQRTGREGVDREDDKGRAVQHAGRLAQKVTEAEVSRDNAIAFASELGASLREIEEATGLPRMTVSRIIARVKSQ